MWLLLGYALQDPPEFRITEEGLQRLADEARRRVERASGVEFEVKPKVRIGTRKELVEILSRELKLQFGALYPNLSPEERAAVARETAENRSLSLVAKFAAGSGEILVLPGTMEWLARKLKVPRLLSAELTGLILVHEHVHALDEQRFGAVKRIAKLRTPEEVEIWNAILEGHAQHVTRRIYLGEGKEDLFREYEEMILKIPPGLLEGEKHLASIVLASFKFSYVDGRKFFDALAKERKETYESDVFAAPPKSKAVILNPETYYHPEKRKKLRDLSPLWEKLRGHFPEEKWLITRREVDRSSLRAAFGDFAEKEELDRALGHFLGGGTFFASDRRSPGSCVVVLVCQADGAEGAGKLYETAIAALRTKADRLKEGPVRILETRFEEFESDVPDRLITYRQRMSVGGTEVAARGLFFAVGAFFVEVDYIVEPFEDGTVRARIEEIGRFLLGPE